MERTERVFRFFRIVLFAAGMLLLTGGFVALSAGWGPAWALSFGKADTAGAPASFADLAEKLRPTVVNISTTKVLKGRQMGPMGGELPFGRFFGNDEFFRRFFGDLPEREFKQKSLGSGFIISEDGYIFTNHHVVEKADKILVKLADGKEYEADVKGRDANTDLALIKIDSPGKLPYAHLGNSDQARIGDWVFAIGNPFGLDHTITAGIISAKGRVIGAGPYDNFIQTDASINPGNSGGPLFNLAGEVVGINTAIVAQGQGIGFAIPINMAKDILDDLKSRGKTTRGWLGIAIQDITDDMREALKLKDRAGALVGDVFPGEPADKAGIKTGDVILEIAEKPVKDSHELLRVVAALKVGSVVTVKVLRDGTEASLRLTVAERKERPDLASGNAIDERFGMTVQEVTPEMARHFSLPDKTGVIVTEVQEGGLADEAGLKAQDILLKVNQARISGLKDFQKAIGDGEAGDALMILVRRGKTSFFVTLKTERK
ncbi:MAG TPA: DegQ family serine endoprotease [Syntrophales bacterium]|nr:DegQ family serine endoprotease [Syntrophales bacterium]